MTATSNIKWRESLVATAILMLGWFSPASRADGLSSTTEVRDFGGVLCGNSNFDIPLSKSTCSANWSAADAFAGTGSAQSFAKYGILGASAIATTSSTSLGGGGYTTLSYADASWNDTLSFANLNQFATLQAVFSLAGTSVSNCGTPGVAICAGTTLGSSARFDNGNGQITDCELTATGSCTVSIAINGQSSVSFFGFLGLNAVAEVTGVGIGSGTASINYYDTAMVDSLLIVDANGNRVQGASIVSSAGTDYNKIAETPEPSSIVLLGAGLLGLIGVVKLKNVTA